MRTPSVREKRLRRFQTKEALLGPAEVIVPLAVVVAPPPTTMPPGPAPVTNERFAGIETKGTEPSAKDARENPTVAVLRMAGEKTCVSLRLKTCMRRGVNEAKSGSASGIKLVPSSIV